MNITETNTTFTVTGEVACDSCDGTGLYVGMAERNGAAVICQDCNGTGKTQFKRTYNKFTKRKIRKGVKRVFQTAAGYVLSSEDVTTKDGNKIHFSKFGADYKDWLDGENPKPIEDLHCPYQHTQQGLQNKDVNGLFKTRCNKHLGFGFIANCKCRSDMATCWKIYHGRNK